MVVSIWPRLRRSWIIIAPRPTRLWISQSNSWMDLSDLINNTRQRVLNTLAQVEVNIDYPEYDDVGNVWDHPWEKTAELKPLTNLLKTARQGKILREGISTIARPTKASVNSGLLSNLLREEKPSWLISKGPGTSSRIRQHQRCSSQAGRYELGSRDRGHRRTHQRVKRSRKALKADLVLRSSIPVNHWRIKSPAHEISDQQPHHPPQQGRSPAAKSGLRSLPIISKFLSWKPKYQPDRRPDQYPLLQPSCRAKCCLSNAYISHQRKPSESASSQRRTGYGHASRSAKSIRPALGNPWRITGMLPDELIATLQPVLWK